METALEPESRPMRAWGHGLGASRRSTVARGTAAWTGTLAVVVSLAALLGSACDGSVGASGIPDAGPTPDAEPAIDAPPSNQEFDPQGRLLIVPPLVTCDPQALPPAQVRVASWNMSAARRGPLDDIIDQLASLDADVILLQEVDRIVERTGWVDQPEVLARELGMAYTFAEGLPWDGGRFGLVILTRLPFSAVRRISIDAAGQSEPRIALEATLCVGPEAVRMVDLHADYVPEANEESFRDLLAAIGDEIGTGLVIAGDYNALINGPGPQSLLAAGMSVVLADRVDFIFADAVLASRFSSPKVIDTDLSDHPIVLANMAGAASAR